MNRAARLEKELASELSGEQGGERQFCAGLQVRVAELMTERRRLRRTLKEITNAACDIHPTAPSSKSVDRLHAAIDKAVAILEG